MSLTPLFRRPLGALIALIILGSALGAGCSDPAPTDPPRTSLPIMPLAVGNRWIGQSYGLDTLGRQIDLVRDTVEIVSSTTVDGVLWYQTRSGMSLRNGSEGLLWLSPSGPKLIAKHPASVGEVFGHDTAMATIGTEVLPVVGAYVVNGVGTMTTVGSTVYSTTVYEMRLFREDGQPYTIGDSIWNADLEYYAPGVGVVQREYFGRSNGQKYLERVWELLEFRK